MSEALRVIRSEHAAIWRLMSTLEHIVGDVQRKGAPLDRAFFGAVFDYLQRYTNRMHHPKEDEYLFKVMRGRSAEVDLILDELQDEHWHGPDVLSRLRELLTQAQDNDEAAREEFIDAVRGYVEAQRAHIRTEETGILPLAEQVLTAEDWEPVDAAFLDNDDPLFGDTVKAEFRDLFSRVSNLAPSPVGLGLDAAVIQPLDIPTAADQAPVSGAAVLRICALDSHYGRIQALDGIELEVAEGELVALVGANGAGKTTLLRTISGLQPASRGEIRFRGQLITRARADIRVALGIAQVPEGRQVFGPLSVEDNLRLGAYRRGKGVEVEVDLERMYTMFPILKQKRRQHAGTLSGGQQQMLAIARALMARPRLLLLDEPSMGLAPLLVQEIFNAIAGLKADGMTIFLVEQNAAAALAVADRGYVIETGRTVLSGSGAALLADEQVKAAYLGM